MKNKKVIVIIVGTIVSLSSLALITNAISNQSQSSNQNNVGENDASSTSSKVAEPNMVVIQKYAFTPEKISIKKGTTVTWRNEDVVEHNVVMTDDTSNGPNGPLLSQGETYSYTFEAVGTYDYLCAPHPYMKGSVEVTE